MCVRFHTTLIDSSSEIERGHKRRKTSLHLEQTQPPRQRLSKIYGYRVNADGKLAILPEEAETIRLVFRRIIEGRSLADIAIELTLRNLRTRFGNKWTTRNLRSLVLHYPWDIHPVIVSPPLVQKAIRVLKQMSESVFDPIAFFRD
jgi:Recombinase